MTQILKLSEDPLMQAERALDRIRNTARICVLAPLPILAGTAAAFFEFEHAWYRNPFLVVIFTLFAAGQVLAVIQLRRVLAGVKNTWKSIAVLKGAGNEPDLEALRTHLLERAAAGHMRDLLLRWIELGLRGETDGSESLLDNAWDRRSLMDNSMVSLHVSINRTTLKVGFLGTLFGLILTFPPMKRAVMGLGESEGELKFIKDISAAIDGDEFAIMITLVATGISILIELVTVQMLERALGGFDMVNSHINDWNLTRLQPWIRKRYGGDAARQGALEGQMRLEERMIEVQAEMELNMGRMLEAMGRTTRHLEQLARVQSVVGQRIGELADFEKQYRGFLHAKQQAVAPQHLRTQNGGGAGNGHDENAADPHATVAIPRETVIPQRTGNPLGAEKGV